VRKGALDLESPPQSHSLVVNRDATTVIASREDQVAVVGTNINVPGSGVSDVTLVSPDGNVLTGDCPAWGYHIYLPEITTTNAWVPITAVIYGLEPGKAVAFRFIPEPGQIIKPLEVVRMSETLFTTSPVAEVMAERPGPQSLNVVVELR